MVFLARGENLKVMQKQGLTLDSLGQKYLVKNAIFTDDASKLADCDLIIFTVKSYDTESAIAQIKPHIKPSAIFLTPQNGISNDKLLAAAFGQEKVIPGFAAIIAHTPKPGYLLHTSLGLIAFGEYDGSFTERIKAIEKLFTDASVQVKVSQNIQGDRWKKFMWNCAFNIISGISGQSTDVILSYKPLHDLVMATIREVEQLAIKEGIDLGDEDVVATRLELARKAGKSKTSTLEDIEKGKPIELEALTGTVLKFAQKHNLSVPVNKTLHALLGGKIIKKN